MDHRLGHTESYMLLVLQNEHRLCHTGSCTLSLLQHETISPLFFPLLLSFLTRRVSVYDCFMFTDTAMVCHTVHYPPQLSSDVCCAKSKLWSSGATPSTSQELKRPQHLTVHIMLYDSGLSFQTAHTCFWGNKHTRRRWSTVKILLAPTLV